MAWSPGYRFVKVAVSSQVPDGRLISNSPLSVLALAEAGAEEVPSLVGRAGLEPATQGL